MLCLRVCLHGCGGPQVEEVTCLVVVEKWPAFTCKPTTLGSWGDNISVLWLFTVTFDDLPCLQM